MKIAIIGSRSYNNYFEFENFILSHIDDDEIEEVISGGAKGADTIGNVFAHIHSKPLRIFPAQWDQYGMNAGFIRNKKIIEESDIIFAAWDGKSHGTKNSIEIANELNKPIWILKF